MAVVITPARPSPQALLKAFDAAIAKGHSTGGITTWKKLGNGSYTHTSANWGGKAMMKPDTTDESRLVFNIRKVPLININQSVYSYYHGHMIETFLNHFASSFDFGVATASPDPADDWK